MKLSINKFKIIQKRTAFTLIELIIVIAILGILAGITIPVFSKHIDIAKSNADIANGKNIATAITAIISKGDNVTEEEISLYFHKPIPTPEKIPSSDFGWTTEPITVYVDNASNQVFPAHKGIYENY